jgi:hypothetical protein
MASIANFSQMNGKAYGVTFYGAGAPHAIVRTLAGAYRGAKVEGADAVADLQDAIMDALDETANEAEAQAAVDAVLAPFVVEAS